MFVIVEILKILYRVWLEESAASLQLELSGYLLYIVLIIQDKLRRLITDVWHQQPFQCDQVAFEVPQHVEPARPFINTLLVVLMKHSVSLETFKVQLVLHKVIFRGVCFNQLIIFFISFNYLFRIPVNLYVLNLSPLSVNLLEIKAKFEEFLPKIGSLLILIYLFKYYDIYSEVCWPVCNLFNIIKPSDSHINNGLEPKTKLCASFYSFKKTTE